MPSLKELLVGLSDVRVVGDENAEVASLAYDSRQVSSGTAFVAVRGHERDGYDFIEQAVQRGAGVIAHLDFGDRANTIIAIFAWYGAMQIPFGIAQLLVGLRYRALVPLFLLLMLIQQALSAYSAWFGKGSHGDHHPPEHYGSVVFVGLGLVFLALSLRRKHSKIQA